MPWDIKITGEKKSLHIYAFQILILLKNRNGGTKRHPHCARSSYHLEVSNQAVRCVCTYLFFFNKRLLIVFYHIT